jgi:SSS family solute:Na+ symporter
MTRNLWQAIWAWVVCLALTVAISLVTKPKSDEELAGLVKGLTPALSEAGVPLFKRPVFWAGVSLLTLLALNIYYW